jgi:hypothetical protein
MNTETKTFALRTLLTVTTGRLLTESKGPRDNGIGAVYELLGWMTNDSPFTHQLPRFAEECKPWLYRWFPELGIGEACLEKLDEWLGKGKTGDTSEGVLMWLAELRSLQPSLKETYDVPRIPQDDHERKDPVAELVAMRGTDEGIVIIDASER